MVNEVDPANSAARRGFVLSVFGQTGAFSAWPTETLTPQTGWPYGHSFVASAVRTLSGSWHRALIE
jgi:hypothetical protein